MGVEIKLKNTKNNAGSNIPAISKSLGFVYVNISLLKLKTDISELNSFEIKLG